MSDADRKEVTEPYTIHDMYAQLARISQVLMVKNNAYLKREAELEVLYRNQPPHVLKVRQDDDYVLTHASNSAKSCAALAGGLCAAITGHIVYTEWLARQTGS